MCGVFHSLFVFSQDIEGGKAHVKMLAKQEGCRMFCDTKWDSVRELSHKVSYIESCNRCKDMV